MKSPFKFLDSFTREDREIFFGREKEIEELYRRVFRSKIMLVYGVSGTGKSSLINCGLANKFQNEDWLPLNIRRGKNMLESMYAAIVAASLTPKSPYSTSDIQFKKYVKSLYLDHYKPIFFIFDQFEELFIFGSKEEKSLFVNVIKTLVDSDIQCRFIFVMREEYMASVTEFEKNIPVFFSNRVRIENMDINNAIQAIKGPCKVFNINIEDGFPEALIENLSPGSPDIELTYLQVFLDKLFRLATADHLPAEGDPEAVGTQSYDGVSFTLDQLKKVGNVSDLLGTFLNEQISLLDDPDSALAVLKSFVSVKGTKRQMSLDDVMEYAQTLGKPIRETILLEMLQNFVNLRILRDKDQHERYELRHDSLATKIFEKISGVEKDILEIRQFIEDGYNNWQKRGVLLSANDLDYIAPYESRLFLSSDLLNYINQSKNLIEKIKSKRRAIFAVATFALLIVFAGFTVWALIERKASKAQEIIAKANYYNALSKELVNSDPTKALRIAEYACKLDPSENNSQNLIDIYSNNDFYNTYLPTRSLPVSYIKVLKKSGNIAIVSNNNLLILSPEGRLVKRTNFEIPSGSSIDISPDETRYLIYSRMDTLKVYDGSGSLLAKTFVKNAIVLQPFFSTDSTVVLTIVNSNTSRGKIALWPLNSDVVETADSFTEGFVIRGSSPDTIVFLIEPRTLYTWLPFKNQTFKKILDFPGSAWVNSANYISRDKIAFLTEDDSLRICNLQGINLKTIYVADEKNSGFYNSYVTDNLNRICVYNDKVIKIFSSDGQSISALKLQGISNIQYHTFNKQLLILNNNKIVTFEANKSQNELVFKNDNKSSRFRTESNYFIESTGSNNYIISTKGDRLEKMLLIQQDDKYWYSAPGAQIVRSRFPKNYTPPQKSEVIIYNIFNGEPMVSLKKLTEIPGRISFSKDQNLIVSSDKMVFTENYSYYTSETFFRLYNKNGDLLRTFPIVSLTFPVLKISSDNRNILMTDRSIAVLMDTSGNQLYRYTGHNANLITADISEDGNYILTGSRSIVRLWSREGKPLKVIESASDFPGLAFLPGISVFQVAERNFIKLFDFNGSMIQKIPANGYHAIYNPDNRFLYYINNQGINRTRIKVPVDSFILSNNHNDLSVIDQIEYSILSVNDILKLKNPNDIYLAGRFYYDNASKKIDIDEKRNTIKTAEKVFQKVLTFDTLQIPIARTLTALCLQKYQFFGESIDKEVDKYFKIITGTDNMSELIQALIFYANGTDSTTTSLKYPDKAISIGEKLLKISPTSSIKYQISFYCSNLAFRLFDFKEQYPNSLKAVKLAIRADSTNLIEYTNLALAYLLNNQYGDAEKVYLKWKDVKWIDPSLKNFREAFLSDFDDLERRGKGHPDFERIRALLKSSN